MDGFVQDLRDCLEKLQADNPGLYAVAPAPHPSLVTLQFRFAAVVFDGASRRSMYEVRIIVPRRDIDAGFEGKIAARTRQVVLALDAVGGVSSAQSQTDSDAFRIVSALVESPYSW